MTKRASPGADTEKSPFADYETRDEDIAKLKDLQEQDDRKQLAVEFFNIKLMQPYFEKRRPTLKTIPKFWPIALMNVPQIGLYLGHNVDQQALSYLEDLWVIRNKEEPRAFTLEFHFKENPYFTNAVLTKEYKYAPVAEAGNSKVDEDGISDAQADFQWGRDVKPQAMKIDWKDPENAFTKKYPRQVSEEVDDDELSGDPGSFFNFFEVEADPMDLGLACLELFMEPIPAFFGDSDEIDSEDEDDDDDDAEEIDLEKPRTKKQKV
ncbi:hypothetical protein BD626DRAFT_486544 [Schizophyllum amplum]|uniref:Nucleosome assembly protein n=1 Tax=Schizophyllum amplum TaxID=97359 RepID=A0A550CMK1_9AGAR|nr:hypothetical protein BD626DRAFT_486544 [Auriculariopsis ampla]